MLFSTTGSALRNIADHVDGRVGAMSAAIAAGDILPFDFQVADVDVTLAVARNVNRLIRRGDLIDRQFADDAGPNHTKGVFVAAIANRFDFDRSAERADFKVTPLTAATPFVGLMNGILGDIDRVLG